jgi:hypothetical protein
LSVSSLVSNRTTYALLSFLAIAVLVSLLYAVDFVSELGGDYAFYFSNGWFLHNGLRPYVDFWTHKPPFLFMLLAVWIGLFGSSFYSAVAFLIVATILCSYSVLVLAYVMRLSRGICFLSGVLFAVFASMHALDPARHGIIIVLASIFELFSLAMLLVGLRRGSNFHLFSSGVLIGVAVASRQTSLTVYLGLLAVIFAFNGLKVVRRAFHQSVVVSFGFAGVGALFLFYLYANGASFRILWDQLYRFNILYAQTFSNSTSVLGWIYFWTTEVGSAQGLLLFSTAGLAYVLSNLTEAIRKRPIGINAWMLLSLLFAHFTSLWLSAQRMPFYILQSLPEASIIASIVIASAVLGGDGSGEASEPHVLRGKAFVVASVVMMLLVPLAGECSYVIHQVRQARAGGYLAETENLPSYEAEVTKKVQEIATNENDRIWLFQWGHDFVYVISNRLPAISFTQSPPLEHVLYSDDSIYRAWHDQFVSNKPKVVVSYFTEGFLEELYQNESVSENLRRIRVTIVSTMDRVNYELEDPEIYVWRER